MKRLRIPTAPPIILLLTALLAASPAAAAAPHAIEDVRGRILDQQKKARRLQEGMQKQQEKVGETREKERGVLAELEALDLRLAEGRDTVARLTREIAAREKTIDEQSQALARLAAEKEELEGHVKKRLAAYYRTGPVGIINILFSSAGLPDLLALEDSFSFLTAHDRRLLDKYRATIGELSAAQEQLEAEQEKQAETLKGLKAKEKALAAAKKEKSVLLARINTEKKLHQRALEELEEATRALKETLRELQGKATRAARLPPRQDPAPQRRPEKGKNFAAMKGKLASPVPGTVITYYGSNQSGRYGIRTVQNGVDIRTKPGTVIRAVFEGTVIYSGFLKGYGNLLVVDHGDHYYSLVSRAGQLLKKEGEPVATGEVLGVMSAESALAAEGLHFEIRRGSEPEDPLTWLDHAGLKTQQAGTR